MISKKNQKEKILYLTVILIGLLLNVIIFNQNVDQNNYTNEKNYNENDNIFYQEKDVKSQESFEDSYSKEWLDNGNFTAGTDPWYNTTEGDDTDVNAQYDSGEAHFDILGSEKTFTYRADPPNNTDWTEVPNPSFPNLTTSHEFRSEGIYADHYWQDQTGVHQPSVHWERNFTITDDMSDYTITNASINLLVNATVGMDLDRYGDSEARDNLVGEMDTIGVGDYIRYYILISDREKNVEYEVGDLQPDLGVGEPGAGHPTDTLPDTLLIIESEAELIFHLTNALATDSHNFTVTLGIRLNIEDNNRFQFDEDTFDEIYLKNFNISIIYQKSIDQNTEVSWNQIGNEIPSGDNVDIKDAELKFDYYINETWPSILSPNSEIIVEINGTEHSEPIGLDTVELYSQEANFDVTNIVEFAGKGVNITLSILVILADDFELDKGIRISVDNVSLIITYSIFIDETITEIDLFLDGINKTLDKRIEVPWRETVNISVSYRNKTSGDFIPDAIVELNYTDAGISERLTDGSAYGYMNYTVVINTTNFKMGNNVLTLDVSKRLYQKWSIDINIYLIKRPASLEVRLNDTLSSTLDFHYISIVETLNITVWYKDFITNTTIDSPQIELIGLVVGPTPISHHPLYEQYNITLNASDLGTGPSFLTVSAQKENYTLLYEDITVIVTQETSKLNLFLNGTQSANNKLVINIWETVNVTVTYTDSFNNHLSGANIYLLNDLGDLDPHPLFNQYYIILNASEMDQGITIISLFAEKTGYEPQFVTFYIEVIEMETKLELWLNSVNKTTSASIVLPITSFLNITVKYTDNNTNHVEDANVRLTGEGLNETLIENFALKQYSIVINTNQLSLGTKILSIVSQKTNHKILAKDMAIELRKIRTDVDTEDGEEKIEIRPGESVKIKIELENLDFGGKIKGADVTYDSKLGDGDLDEEDDGIYEFTLDDVAEGTYIIEISVFKEGGQYEFKDLKITLTVKRPAEENLLFLILFIVAVVVSVSLAGYLIAYQRILKYPKPVRKVRKYRRTLKKKNAPSVDITGREKAFKSVYSGFISTNLKKGKTSTEIAESDKMVKKSLKSSIGVIAKKPVEK